jgi:hypothetical protein
VPPNRRATLIRNQPWRVQMPSARRAFAVDVGVFPRRSLQLRS